MKKLRKYFNWPAKKELQLINEDYISILKILDKKSKEYDKAEIEKQKLSDNTCPHCKEQTDIVNKISKVRGESGIFFYRGEIDTFEVNHCNKCGNQWEKYKIKNKWMQEFFIEMMSELIYTFDTNDKEPEFKIKTQEVIDELKPFYAESIYKISKLFEDIFTPNTKQFVSLEKLRTIFKSVYN